jgi:hypothetical protein
MREVKKDITTSQVHNEGERPKRASWSVGPLDKRSNQGRRGSSWTAAGPAALLT